MGNPLLSVQAELQLTAILPCSFFLLCRAIELEIKSRPLKHQKQKEDKIKGAHKLSKAYNALGPPEKILSLNETQILDAADQSYAGKCFEYFDLEDAPLVYSRYPDMNALDSIAKKLIDRNITQRGLAPGKDYLAGFLCGAA